MNNKSQKNLILSRQMLTKLPYSVEDVKFPNKELVNSVTVNNLLTQLRDNDLYLENEISSKQIYNIGPKTNNEENRNKTIDGYKTWDFDEGDIKIIRRINTPLSNSVENTYLGDKNILWIKKYQNFIIVGTTSGVWYMSNSLSAPESSGSWENIETFDNTAVSCCYIDTINDKVYLGADNGMFSVNVTGVNYNILSATLETSAVLSVSTIYVDDECMFVGGRNEENTNHIIMTKPNSLSTFNIEEIVETKTSTTKIDPAKINEFFRYQNNSGGKDTYAITDTSVFLSSFQSTLSDYTKVEEGYDKFITVGNSLYGLSGTNLLSIANDGVYHGKNVYRYYQNGNDFYYLSSGADKNIYKNNAGAWLELSGYLSDINNVSSFSVFDINGSNGAVVSLSSGGNIYVLFNGSSYNIESGLCADYLYSEITNDCLLVLAYSNNSIKLWTLARYGNDFKSVVTDGNISGFNCINNSSDTRGMLPLGNDGYIYYTEHTISSNWGTGGNVTDDINILKIKKTSPADASFGGNFLVVTDKKLYKLTIDNSSITLTDIISSDSDKTIIDADVSNDRLFIALSSADEKYMRSYGYSSSTWQKTFEDMVITNPTDVLFFDSNPLFVCNDGISNVVQTVSYGSEGQIVKLVNLSSEQMVQMNSNMYGILNNGTLSVLSVNNDTIISTYEDVSCFASDTTDKDNRLYYATNTSVFVDISGYTTNNPSQLAINLTGDIKQIATMKMFNVCGVGVANTDHGLQYIGGSIYPYMSVVKPIVYVNEDENTEDGTKEYSYTYVDISADKFVVHTGCSVLTDEGTTLTTNILTSHSNYCLPFFASYGIESDYTITSDVLLVATNNGLSAFLVTEPTEGGLVINSNPFWHYPRKGIKNLLQLNGELSSNNTLSNIYFTTSDGLYSLRGFGPLDNHSWTSVGTWDEISTFGVDEFDALRGKFAELSVGCEFGGAGLTLTTERRWNKLSGDVTDYNRYTEKFNVRQIYTEWEGFQPQISTITNGGAVLSAVALNPNNVTSDNFPCSVILYCGLESDHLVPKKYAFLSNSVENYLYKYSYISSNGTNSIYYNVSAVPNDGVVEFIISSDDTTYPAGISDLTNITSDKLSNVYRITDTKTSYDNSIRLLSAGIVSCDFYNGDYDSTINNILPIDQPKHCQLLNLGPTISSYEAVLTAGGNFLIHNNNVISVGALSANSDNPWGFFEELSVITGLTNVTNAIVDINRRMFVCGDNNLLFKNLNNDENFTLLTSGGVNDIYYTPNAYNVNREKWAYESYQSYDKPIDDVVVKYEDGSTFSLRTVKTNLAYTVGSDGEFYPSNRLNGRKLGYYRTDDSVAGISSVFEGKIREVTPDQIEFYKNTMIVLSGNTLFEKGFDSTSSHVYDVIDITNGLTNLISAETISSGIEKFTISPTDGSIYFIRNNNIIYKVAQSGGSVTTITVKNGSITPTISDIDYVQSDIISKIGGADAPLNPQVRFKVDNEWYKLGEQKQTQSIVDIGGTDCDVLNGSTQIQPGTYNDAESLFVLKDGTLSVYDGYVLTELSSGTSVLSGISSFMFGYRKNSNDVFYVVNGDGGYYRVDNNYSLTDMPLPGNGLRDENRIVFLSDDGDYITVGDDGLYKSALSTHIVSSSTSVEVDNHLSNVTQITPVTGGRLRLVAGNHFYDYYYKTNNLQSLYNDGFTYGVIVEPTSTNEFFISNGDNKYHIKSGQVEQWTDPYLSITESTSKQIVRINGNVNKYYVLGDNFYQSFSGIDNKNPIFYPLNGDINQIRNPLAIAANQYLVIKENPDDKDDLQVLEFGISNSITLYSLEGLSGMGFFDKYSSLNDYYLYSLDKNLYRVTDWQKYSSNSKEFLLSVANKITSAIPLTQHVYLIGTDNGLFATRFKYDEANDITKYTSDDAKQLFTRNQTRFNDQIQSAIVTHVGNYHSDGNIIKYINENVVDVDLERYPSSFGNVVGESDTLSSGGDDALSSIVYYTSESSDDIKISSGTSVPKFSWIEKTYMSNIHEFLIYVDSLSVEYSDDSSDKEWTVEINKMNGYIMLDVQVCGNSLPLNINVVGDGNFIKPVDQTTVTQIFTNAKMKFKTHGTDAQAIRLVLFKP